MNDQVENLFDANNMMGTCYAILNEGIKDPPPTTTRSAKRCRSRRAAAKT